MRWMAWTVTMALYVFGATGCGIDKAPDSAGASAVKARIEWRLASNAPRAGYAEAAYQGRPVYLAPQQLLAVDGAATVTRVDGDDGKPALDLRFPGHDDRLTRTTEQNIGKPIALLADGQVLTVATVAAPRRQTADQRSAGCAGTAAGVCAADACADDGRDALALVGAIGRGGVFTSHRG
ncbi:Conserved hypothetical protein [Xanthomonas translucens pv. translucens DSM 18974]|uniref:Uncharacterized protein n=3 Tax=Xanthomonas campestris pv. translucens TaxID=343 RepID=A0A1C3TJ27_XANCT|nr:hypothetical protein BN444_03561 [Xanthomonas translucens pv. translucens DSM 18974]SCB03199.1 Conserved hypothetical protein [Xanthomonas translucens pv. translucens DSM 18974]